LLVVDTRELLDRSNGAARAHQIFHQLFFFSACAIWSGLAFSVRKELRHDQKDSDSLPPYEVLDAILELFIEDNLSVDEISARGFDRATVGRVLQMVKRNEYKRRQAPPGVRISDRAFGRDWRYPITSGYRTR
jgi:hypothetical protein